jgi:hypothetical protein
VSTDLNARVRKVPKLVRCIRRERHAGGNIVREMLTAEHVIRGNEVREWDIVSQQVRHGERHVVGIPVVERDARSGKAIAAGNDTGLCFGERNDVEAVAEPADLRSESARGYRPVVRVTVGDTVVEHHAHGLGSARRAINCCTATRGQCREVVGFDEAVGEVHVSR